MSKGTKIALVAVGLILLLIILIFWVMPNFKQSKDCPESIALKKKIDSLNFAIATRNYQVKIDSLKNANRALTNSLAVCHNNKQKKISVVSSNNYKKKANTKKIITDNSENKTVSRSFFKPKTSNNNENVETVIVETTKSSSTYRTSLDGVKYVGLKDGDFYTTISSDQFLQYVFSKKLYDEAGGTGVPELNFKGSGKFFELSEDGTEYIYIDRSISINTNLLDRNWGWCVYIGEKDGYDAYIPHEIIKPEITQARGSLAGTISAEDVTNIGALVAEVQIGRIKPNKVTGVGKYDGQTYEGWHFFTKLLYEQQ